LRPLITVVADTAVLKINLRTFSTTTSTTTASRSGKVTTVEFVTRNSAMMVSTAILQVL
jgi:hypothetical protein